jgi:hypothetical protein
MEASYWIYPILSFLALVGIIAGLWIAGKFLPTFINWIRVREPNDLLSQSFIKILLWLALGGLFTLPLLDFVRWLGNLMNLVLAFVGQADNGFFTSLGLISSQIYFVFHLILVLALYGIVVWFAMDFLSAPDQFNQITRIFMVLTIASLFYRGVSNIFIYIFSIQLPPNLIQKNYGVSGFLIEVVVGFVILCLILFGLNKFMANHPAKSD